MKLIYWIAAAFILIASACNSGSKQDNSNPELFKEYIFAYPKNEVNRSEYMKVIFTKPVAEDMASLPDLDNSILGVYPNVGLKLNWEDTKTIAFKPATKMDWGAVYHFSLNLKALFPDISADLKFFNFSTKTKVFEVDILVRNSPIYSEESNSVFELEGTLMLPESYSEFDQSNFLDGITARQDGKEVALSFVNFSPNEKDKRFLIQSLVRKDEPSVLEIVLNNSILGALGETKKVLDIPARGDFVVTEVVYNRTTPKEVQIFFSEILDKTQDLTGLVGVKGMKGVSYLKRYNQVTLFLPKVPKDAQNIFILSAVKSAIGKSLSEEIYHEINAKDETPEIQFLSVGGIIPPADGELLLPIKTINLNKVVLEVFKIYPNNVLQFFQSSNFDNSSYYQLNYVGEIIKQVEVDLASLGETPYINTWHNYAIDLREFVEVEPGALYEVRLGKRFQDILLDCEAKNDVKVSVPRLDDRGNYISMRNYDFFGSEYFENENEGNELCSASSYGGYEQVSKIILGSDKGLVLKMTETNQLFGAVTSLSTSEPIADATITFYDYVQQPIKSFVTDGNGFFEGAVLKEPFVAVVEKGGDVNYLKINDGKALSMASYDVSGYNTKAGLKGFFYGDRGVWRPGDSVFVNFVLFDPDQTLPSSHPVTFEVSNPKGKTIFKTVKSDNEGGIYAFPFTTNVSSPTGSYTVKAALGTHSFSKVIKIETVKPNRLIANINLPKLIPSNSLDKKFPIDVKWLHGAKGSNLEVKVSAKVTAIEPPFKKFTDYSFIDISKPTYTDLGTIAETQTDENGTGELSLSLSEHLAKASGFQRALLEVNVFEPGGNFSTQFSQSTASPFDSYVGIKIPSGEYGGNYLYDNTKSIQIIVVDAAGKPVANQLVDIGFYKMQWRWWYQRNNNGLNRFAEDKFEQAVSTTKVTTNANGIATVSLDKIDNGRFFVKAILPDGHSAGAKFALYSYGYWDDLAGSGKEMRKNASMLNMKVNKESFKVGEEVSVSLPTNNKGKILVSLENGSKVVDKFWVFADEGKSTFNFTTRKEMVPNVYVNVSYLQPHSSVENDLPLRLYGVQSIEVLDEETKLEPIVKVPEKIEPNQELSITVRETNGKPMAYTVAVVDEGLLSLTNFKTPNPHSFFYSKEALGVKTWDIFDDVIGGFAMQMEQSGKTGGDEVRLSPDKLKKANRFKSVAKLIGPFYLERGASTHKIKIPNYLGAVRVMVTAASDRAFGATSETVTVNKAIMGLTTLPRVLNIGNTLSVPVNVFVNEENIKNVTVSVKPELGMVRFTESTKKVSFKTPGEKTVYFNTEVLEPGIEKIKVVVSGGGKQSEEEIEIDIVNPNPMVYQSKAHSISPKEQKNIAIPAIGQAGTNEVSLELSALPSMNLTKHLNQLIQYPHGCVEQTTSKIMPQLFVHNLYDLSKEQKAKMETFVKKGITKLSRFQVVSGGFSYWEGGQANDWSSSYVGHCLLMAQKQGYQVPASVLDNWAAYQLKVSNNWNGGNSFYQSYRLFTLALSGNPAFGAMNRLREQNKLKDQEKYWLAGAYAIAGQQEAAREIIAGTKEIVDYREISQTFGSGLRDKALALETILRIDGTEPLQRDMAEQIARKLGSRTWLSTQEAGVAFSALSQYADKVDVKGFDATAVVQGQNIVFSGGKVLSVKSIKIKGAEDIVGTFTNNSDQKLYLNVTSSGKPSNRSIAPYANVISLDMAYEDADGNAITTDQIKQGINFKVIATVKNAGSSRYSKLEDLVLETVFPSGWEIKNSRVGGATQQSDWDYQDIRDDRVYTYFGIRSNKTKTFTFDIIAAYTGTFELPAMVVKAMYDNDITSNTSNSKTKVVK